jgi:hypothetical protein
MVESPPVAEDKLPPEFNQFVFSGPMFGGLGNQVFYISSIPFFTIFEL